MCRDTQLNQTSFVIILLALNQTSFVTILLALKEDLTRFWNNDGPFFILLNEEIVTISDILLCNKNICLGYNMGHGI
jgi:hypothetical protein